MVADLYEALGVERGCSGPEVRRAYRRAAKRAHPDGGGSSAKFAVVRLAHDVLTDAARRVRYDLDGTIEETVPDTRQAMALNLIAGALDVVVTQIAGQRGRPERVDLIDRVRAVLKEKKRAVLVQKEGLSTAIGIWSKLDGRFRRKTEGENLLGAVARGKIDALRSTIGQCDAEVEKIVGALELLLDYRFEVNAAQGLDMAPAAMGLYQLLGQAGRMW